MASLAYMKICLPRFPYSLDYLDTKYNLKPSEQEVIGEYLHKMYSQQGRLKLQAEVGSLGGNRLMVSVL